MTANTKKNVVITGCSAGVGESAAHYFAEQGWQVYAIVRKQVDADKLIDDSRGVIKTCLADVTDYKALQEAVNFVADDLGVQGLDALICNAGCGGSGPIEFLPIDELEMPININFYGTVYCNRLFLPLLRKAKGKIINLTSGSMCLAMPNLSTYPAAKAALEVYSRQLQAEVSHFGIRVIVVDPGHVKSRMTQTAPEQSKMNLAKLPPESFEFYGDIIENQIRIVDDMIGSGKEPEDVAKVYYKIATSKNPKSFYAVGADGKVMRFLAKWAPEWVKTKVADYIQTH